MTSIIVKPANKQEFIFLKDLFQKMRIQFKPIFNLNDNEDDSEEWYRFAMSSLSEAYSDDEPEYTTDMIKELNPEYNPTFESQL